VGALLCCMLPVTHVSAARQVGSEQTGGRQRKLQHRPRSELSTALQDAVLLLSAGAKLNYRVRYEWLQRCQQAQK
jgi:hypothetical protein